MFGRLKKPRERLSEHKTADSGFHISSKSNPFDSDDELDDDKHTLKPSNRISPEPSVATKNFSLNAFDNDDEEVEKRSTSSSKLSFTLDAKSRYRNDYRDSGGVENQTVEELESYAVYKSEETTKNVQGCLKVAEDIRSDATRTLVMLNEQGGQMTRTHQKAVDIDHDLSRGEKLLGSLGGEFPKRNVNHLETREKLGLNHLPKPQSKSP